jgi:hypothetical protein
MTKLLLKCRPTERQLTDRLAEPVPDGLELYLDAADISGDGWLPGLQARIGGHNYAPGFAWIVEGPLRSLDGEYFDISNINEANVEVVRRLVAVGQAIGAAGVVIHAIAPVASISELTLDARRHALENGFEFLAGYAKLCLSAGLVPTIENIPPVARMRESSFTYSLLGVDTGDLQFYTAAIEGLRATFDISHAGLFVNSLSIPEEQVEEELRPLLVWMRSQSAARTINDCIEDLGDEIWNVHVSNARGLLDEGLPYEVGEYDIDYLIPLLAKHATNIVTETIEPDADRAVFMRRAQERIQNALGRRQDESGGRD